MAPDYASGCRLLACWPVKRMPFPVSLLVSKQPLRRGAVSAFPIPPTVPVRIRHCEELFLSSIGATAIMPAAS
jgi:hypothetical protein